MIALLTLWMILPMNRAETAKNLVVTALGLGRLPVAPGSWASAGATVVYLGLAQAVPGTWRAAVLAAAVVLCMVLGVGLGPWAEAHYGRKDPRPFVLDEVAGQWVTFIPLVLLPPLAIAPLAFLAFRICDVTKPYPIRRLEPLPGGWGMMLDDLLAGAYASVLAGGGWLAVRALSG